MSFTDVAYSNEFTLGNLGKCHDKTEYSRRSFCLPIPMTSFYHLIIQLCSTVLSAITVPALAYLWLLHKQFSRFSKQQLFQCFNQIAKIRKRELSFIIRYTIESGEHGRHFDNFFLSFIFWEWTPLPIGTPPLSLVNRVFPSDVLAKILRTPIGRGLLCFFMLIRNSIRARVPFSEAPLTDKIKKILKTKGLLQLWYSGLRRIC